MVPLSAGTGVKLFGLQQQSKQRNPDVRWLAAAVRYEAVMPAVRCCSRGRISRGQFERRNTFLPANAAALDRATAELHCRDQTFRCNVCHFVGGDRVGAGDSERIGAVESQVLKVVKAHV